MINGSKEEILQRLSEIDGLVFVGGTSEYLQGIKEELRDIDVSVKSFDLLREIGYIHKGKDLSFYGASGERGFIPLRSVLVDVFIDEKIDFITVEGYKCETVSSMLERQEKTIENNAETLARYTKDKLKENIKRLKAWQTK